MKSNNKKLIAEIIPAVKLPRGITPVFSYAVPNKFEKKVKIGMLAEIYFRNKKIIGLVNGLKKKSSEDFTYQLKNIENLLDNSVSLSTEQIKLAEYLANYYYVPLSLVIKTIIPPIAKNKARKNIELNDDCQITEIKKDELNKFLKKSQKKDKLLLIHSWQATRHSLYCKIIKKETKTSEQALILLPEYFDVYNFANFYLNKFGETKVAILTSELTKNQHFSEWQKIRNKKAKIIIGTRQAVFAPFQNLKLIITDDEHSSSYKQWDSNPRYHGIKVAEKLAEIWKAKIILSSPTPSLENYNRLKNKIEIIGDKKTLKNKSIKLIDINAERQQGNYSVLSDDLKDSLLKNIYQRRQAIIFIPRLGNNTVIQCRDCNWIAQCQNCQTTLLPYPNYLYCQKCQEKISLLQKCPECQGQNLNSFGFGSEKIEREIKKLFQNKNIKISRLDSNTASNKSKQIKIYRDFSNKKIDVLIGTQMVLKNWNLENLALTAVLFPEIIFNQPDFKSREKSFQFLVSLNNKASEKHQVIIQTNKPDNNIFQVVLQTTKSNNLKKFYATELQNRLAFSKNKIGYPPFAQLIKFIYKDNDSKKCEEEALSLYQVLQNRVNNDKSLQNKFEIMPPSPATNFREFGKYRWHLIVKSTCQDVKLRNLFLNSTKKNWIIDIDPDEIF